MGEAHTSKDLLRFMPDGGFFYALPLYNLRNSLGLGAASAKRFPIWREGWISLRSSFEMGRAADKAAPLQGFSSIS